MSEPGFTLVQACRHQQEIRKSRFLALAAPVETSGQALDFVRDACTPAATHNCWAYRIAQDYRFNDDGEPGGTAGRPILQAIDSQGMDGVVVVVTRWYGGIKLGAGGLARAYGGTAAECLRLAERVAIVAMARVAVHVAFAELLLLKARLKNLHAEVERETFVPAGVELQLRVPVTQVEAVQALIVDLTRGRGSARRLD